MSTTVDILIQVRSQLADLQKTVDGMKRVGSAATEAAKASSALGDAFRVGGAFGLGQMTFQGIAAAVTGAARATIAYRAEIEQQTVAFQTLLGSAEAARSRMEDLTQFAADTPFELPEIVNASKVLQALGDSSLATGDGLRLVGDAAAAAGRSFDETAMWIGRLYGGLKAGIPVGEATLRLTEMGLVSGETARRLNEMAEKGTATGRAMDVLKEAFGKSAGAMELQSRTMNGMMSTLRDTMMSLGSDAIEPATDLMKELLETTLEFLGAVDRAGAKTGSMADAANRALSGAAKPTSEADRQAKLVANESALKQSRERLEELQTLARQQEDLEKRIRQMSAFGTPANASIVAGSMGARFMTKEEIAELQALPSSISAYEAALRRLASVESTRKAAEAEASAETAAAVAAQKKAQEEAAAWLEKNGRAAREVVAEYARGQLPLGEQIRQLEEIVALEEESMASALRRSGSEQESQRIRLEAETRLIAMRRDLASLTKELADEETRATREAVKRQLDSTGRDLDAWRQQISGEQAGLDRDFSVGRVERRAKALELQQREISLLDAEIARREALRDLQTDDGARADVQRSIDGLRRERRSAEANLGRSAATGDPQSVTDQMRLAMRELEEQTPTVAEGIALTFRSTIGSAISSISDGVQGLILGTKSWGSALKEIGVNVFQTILKSIVDMAVQWAVTHVIMRGISTAWAAFTTALGWQQVAQTNAQEAAKAPALATNAAMASAGSYGISAIVGVAALVAAIGVAIAAAAGAFADGGYVAGAGGPRDDKILARLSNGEYVVNAKATAENRPLLETINAGGRIDVAPMSPTVNVGAAPVSIAVLNNREELLRWMESAEGQKAIFDTVRRRRIDLGGTT